MIRILLTIIVATSIDFANAQDLVFDNTFNNGNPYLDNLPATNGVGQNNHSYSDYGRMKQLNDSVFVYYINTVKWDVSEYRSEARAVISHSNGTTQHLQIDVFSGSFSTSSFANGNPDDFFVTDIIINPSNEQVFVIRNGLYNDGAPGRRCVFIKGYQYVGIGPSFPAISDWGINGNGLVRISASGTNMYGAKGSLMGNYPCVAYSYGNYPSTINVAFSILGNNGAFTGFSVITSNVPTLFSQVADVVIPNINEVYIADNAYTYNSSNITYNDNSRILKLNNSFVLDNTYGGGDGIADFSLGIATQQNTPFIQDRINRIMYDNQKIWIAGSFVDNKNAQVNPHYGAVIRLAADGTLDNIFATNGKFSPNFSSDRFRWAFNDIDKSADGSLYLSGRGSVSGGTSSNDPSECFILAVNDVGAIQTGKGNNGFLFETTDYSEIVGTIIVPGNTTSDDKFVFNGMRVLNSDPQMYKQETAVGRLMWGNGTTGINEFISQNSINISPNPASTVLNIDIQNTLNATETTDIKIVNLLGETVSTELLNIGNNTIDVSKLTNGVYFIFIDNEKGRVAKFIKE